MQNIKTVNLNKLVKEQSVKNFFKKISLTLKNRFKNIKATSATNIKGEFVPEVRGALFFEQWRAVDSIKHCEKQSPLK